MAKHLLSIEDLTLEEIKKIFKEAKKFKAERGQEGEPLKNKSLAMFFERASTRTRISFEVAMTELGGHALNLDPKTLAISKGETYEDTAKVLARYVHGMIARVYDQKTLARFAQVATIPVINALSNLEHPCQALTDIFTVSEKRSLDGLKFVYLGDCEQNTAASLEILTGKLGIHLTAACPPEYKPRAWILEKYKNIEIINDPLEAVKDAHVLYTDEWVNPGFEHEAEQRMKILRPYQLNQKVVEGAREDVLVMHCLPANRNTEITDEVLDGPHSIVFDQAENRLHIQKAILVMLID